jgi:HAD superfamily hydrolase (TIGR01458 family)
MAIKVSGFLLDVEGVLVADKRYTAVEGAVSFVGRLREDGVPFRLITNNTTDSRAALVEKLEHAGFDFAMEELHTCTAAAAALMRSRHARRCLVLGTVRLAQIFVDEGFEVLDSSDVDAVIVGLDTGLTYERLRLACEAVANRDAALIALHRNRLFTDLYGRVSPSVGPIVEAIRFATHVEPTVVGKPSPDYYRQVLEEVGVPAHSVMVVSDDPCSDLAGAKRLGMRTAFVLSGKYPETAALEGIPEAEAPDVVAPRIGDLLTEGMIEI